MRSIVRLAIRSCSLVLVASFWGGLVEAREFSAVGGFEFEACYADSDCSLGGTPTCGEGQFPAGSCHARCENSCVIVESEVRSFSPWNAIGLIARNFGDSILPLVLIEASGERQSEDLFSVSGSYRNLTGGDLELAVVRYDGDPADLENEEYASVFDLVVLGLIETSDILLVEMFPDSSGLFNFEVGVPGLADDEIAVFVGGTDTSPASCDPVCVPATGPLAIAVLGLVLMALSRRQLRRSAGA